MNVNVFSQRNTWSSRSGVRYIAFVQIAGFEIPIGSQEAFSIQTQRPDDGEKKIISSPEI